MKIMTARQQDEALGHLNRRLKAPWVIRGGKLHKEFRFADFISAFGFMTRVAIHAEKVDHHPDWSNAYNRVTVDLVTHHVDGITTRDFALAKVMEQQADPGSVEAE